MQRHPPLTRTHRIARIAPDYQRPIQTRRPVVRADVAVPAPLSPSSNPVISPYVDYGCHFTSEGGVLIVYKDFDQRLRHIVWALFAWMVSTGFEAWLLHQMMQPSGGVRLLCFFAVFFINFMIVAKPVEIYRRVEIRPDCLILDGAHIFWLRFMECGWPTFRQEEDGSQILCGIYGTRFVDYLTIRTFDEFDRGIDVFKSHLQQAMQQLWNRPK